MKLNRGHKGILLIAAAILASVVFLTVPRRSHFPELPNPNGYDVLVREAARITHATPILNGSVSSQFASLVATNAAAVRDIRKALRWPCIVPVKTSEGWLTSQMTNTLNLWEAATAMNAEAIFWRQRGGYTNAMALYLDQVRLSHAIMRGDRKSVV